MTSPEMEAAFRKYADEGHLSIVFGIWHDPVRFDAALDESWWDNDDSPNGPALWAVGCSCGARESDPTWGLADARQWCRDHRFDVGLPLQTAGWGLRFILDEDNGEPADGPDPRHLSSVN